MEEPDLGELGSKVADEDNGGAVPLFLKRRHLLGLDLVLVEEGDLVHDHEGNAAAEVDEFVHDEAHDAGRERVVLHVKVPSLISRQLASCTSRGPSALRASRQGEMLIRIVCDIQPKASRSS